MGLLTRKQILEAEDRKIVHVEVPEWEGAVSLRPMSAVARDRFTAWCANNSLPDGDVDPWRITSMTTKLLSLTMCDESGDLMFTEDDVARLAAKSGEVIDRVFKVAQQINGIGQSSGLGAR